MLLQVAAFAFLAFCGYVAYLTFTPEIIRYPYPRVEKKERACVYSGSFNPAHDGHLAILRALRNRFETVYAIVGYNPLKKYPVTPERRADLLRKMLRKNGLPSIKVVVVPGLIFRFAKKHNAVMARGFRNLKKDGPDEYFLNFLNIIGPLLFGPFQAPMKTVLLQANPGYTSISSSRVRNARALGEEVEAFVEDKEIATEISRLYTPQNTTHTMTNKEQDKFRKEMLAILSARRTLSASLEAKK